MPHYNFKKDLPIAMETEKEIAAMLEKKGFVILESRRDNKYDVRASFKGKEYTFEIKEDFTCEKTGNVGLEYGCRGKPSGIEVTEADFYIYKVHTKALGIKYIVTRVKVLKEMIAKSLYFRKVNGGDWKSNSLCYLFKYDVFAQHGHYL